MELEADYEGEEKAEEESQEGQFCEQDNQRGTVGSINPGSPAQKLIQHYLLVWNYHAIGQSTSYNAQVLGRKRHRRQ